MRNYRHVVVLHNLGHITSALLLVLRLGVTLTIPLDGLLDGVFEAVDPH